MFQNSYFLYGFLDLEEARFIPKSMSVNGNLALVQALCVSGGLILGCTRAAHVSLEADIYEEKVTKSDKYDIHIMGSRFSFGSFLIRRPFYMIYMVFI